MLSRASSGKGTRWTGFIGAILILVGAAVGFGGDYSFSLTKLEVRARAAYSLAETLEKGNAMSTNVELLSVTHPVGVKVWWQLLEYRIQIRLLLRGIVKLHDPALPDSDDPSYEKLLKRVHALGLITDEESGTLDEIRRHTHYFEWGTQDIPSKDEIGFVLRESPKMIEV